MTNGSEEGEEEGLGWVNAYTHRFKIENKIKYKVPHMGWNKVKQIKDHPLWKDVPDNSRFYFVHSYYVHTADEIKITGTTSYGTDIISCLAEDNIFATQFHPEKSDKLGLQIIKNFLNL